MERGDFITAAWQAAEELGLLSRWEFWAVVVFLFVGLVLKKMGIILGPNSLFLPTKPQPEWDPEKGTGNLSPPIDMPPGGAPLDQKPPETWE